MQPSARDYALVELRAENRKRRPRIRLNEPPEYRAILAAVERIEGATRYLQDIKDALERATPIPKPFHDHQLSGALRQHRSVIVGDLEYGQVTFPLVYRRRRAVIDLIVVEQHSDVYRLAKRK